MSAPASLPSPALRWLGRRTWVTAALVIVGVPLAVVYLDLAFTFPNPAARIGLRVLPVLPLAVWTLWFDRQRPFETAPPALRLGGRLLSLLGIMALALALLGLTLNWVYDPARVL
jgi:hypothetical protein